MASPNFAKKNPFMGMTVAQMKAYYDKKVRGKKLSAAELKNMANQMQAAKKAAPKAKPAASKPKPAASKPRQTTKEQAASRFYRSSSGTRGENMPSNPQLKSQPKDKPVRSRGVGVKGRLPEQPKSTSKPSSRGVGVRGRGTGTPAPSRPGGRAERARRNPPAPAPRRRRLSIAERRRARRSSR